MHAQCLRLEIASRNPRVRNRRAPLYPLLVVNKAQHGQLADDKREPGREAESEGGSGRHDQTYRGTNEGGRGAGGRVQIMASMRNKQDADDERMGGRGYIRSFSPI